MLLAIGSMTVMAIALTSCKKDSPAATAAPTIASISPASDTALQVITITGTNLTGATVTVGGNAAAITANTGTVITTSVPASTSLGSSVVVSVHTAGGTITSNITVVAALHAIHGKTSSDQVQTANLLAHWTFDNTTDEVLSSTSPFGTSIGSNPGVSGGTATFVTGKIGNAVHLDGTTGGWLTYPVIPAIGNDLTGSLHYNNNDTLYKGFTITMWAQIPTTTASAPSLYSLFQINGLASADFWALAGVDFRKHSDGFVDLDASMTNIDGTGTHSSQDGLFSGHTFNDSLTWAFIAVVYDTTAGGSIIYYGNGVPKASVALSTLTGAKIVFPSPEAFLMETPNYVTFGAFSQHEVFPAVGTTGASWNNLGFTGNIDDARLFKATLSATDIDDLYQLGNQGR